MKSMTDLHVDRPDEPILSETEIDGYQPKRVPWSTLLAVAILVVAASAGMVVSGRNDSNLANGSPQRTAQAAAPSQSPQAERSNTPRRDEQKATAPAKPK